MDAPTNIGIIGTGGRGMLFGRGIVSHSEQARITALCDVNPKRLKAAQELLGVDCALYTDYRELLAHEGLEAAIITTPDYTHEEIAQASFAAGLHTLCEKPLATTAAGCRKIIAAADQAGKILEVGFVLRYVPLFERVRDIVQRGDLGTPRLIEMSDHYSGGATYFRRWNRLRRYSGGLLIHKGTHDFDLLNWILGQVPSQVAVFAGNNVFVPDPNKGERCLTCENRCEDYTDITKGYTGKMYYEAEDEDGYIRDVCLYNSEKDTHDSATVMLDYDGQARAVYTECFHPAISGRRLNIIGDKAQLLAYEREREIAVTDRYTGERTVYQFPEPEGGHGGGDVNQLESFVAGIREGKPTRATGEAGLLSVAVSEAAEQAWRSNQIVSVTELLKG